MIWWWMILLHCAIRASSYLKFSTNLLNLHHLKMSTNNLLSCQEDSYKKEGISKVISCIKDTNNLYQVTLEDSVLYPEGGGQPWDFGYVAGERVEKVIKGIDERQVQVELSKPLEEGTEVMCIVDWNRRYDFMQQHTAQHLFSAVADKLFKAETIGWSLGTETVSVDLSTPILLTSAQLTEIEDECNRLIASGAHVKWKIFSKDQIIAADNNNTTTATTTDIESNHELALLRGAPKGAALELNHLRMVYIENLDLNPCGGTHLHGLNEINILKILGFEKDNNRKCIRVRFISGNRALNYFKRNIITETTISTLLSVPPLQHIDSIQKLLYDKKDINKRLDIYTEELAELYALSLLSSPEKALNSVTIEDKCVLPDMPIYAYHRCGADLKFLMKVANVLHSAYQKQYTNNSTSSSSSSSTSSSSGGSGMTLPLIYLSGDNNMPIYTSTLEPPKTNNKPVKKAKSTTTITTSSTPSTETAGEVGLSGPFILFGPDEIVKQLREPLLGIIHGKGGGRPGKLQGTAMNLQTLEDVQQLLLTSSNHC